MVKCEYLVGPIKRGDPVLQRAYMALFERFAALDMPEPVYLQAAELRGHFGFEDTRCAASRLCAVSQLQFLVDQRRSVGASLARARPQHLEVRVLAHRRPVAAAVAARSPRFGHERGV
jgi:hypothetical protein